MSPDKDAGFMQPANVRSRAVTDVDLPVAITQVVSRIPDGTFRDRLATVMTAAANAIVKLRDLDLTRIEQLASDEESSDLAMWEEIAPAVGASISNVNTLLGTIGDSFPQEEGASEDDDVDLAFGPATDAKPKASKSSIAVTVEEKQEQSEKAIHSIAQSLVFEVGRFGKRVRNPTVVADRWNLLIDLQEFRGKCRAAIRELVFSALSAFGEVDRAAVVPEYALDLDEALACRHAWITLTRAVGPLNARLQIAGVEQQRPLLLAIQRELHHFRATHGYMRMRAGDKRAVIAFTRDLDATLMNRSFGKAAQLTVEGFAKFLDSMSVINRREILINHDRETFAECGRLLEQATESITAKELDRAAGLLRKALSLAMRLFGRDRFLDDYLVLRLRWPLDHLVPTAMPFAVEELRECLAESNTHAPGSF